MTFCHSFLPQSTTSLPNCPSGIFCQGNTIILQVIQHFSCNCRMTDGPDFVSTNFTFFDCNTFSSCTSCVSSPFPCDWCVDGHRCTHDTAENCRNDILVTGVKRVGPSIRSGPNFCPRINATIGSSTEVLVPSGVSKQVK